MNLMGVVNGLRVFVPRLVDAGKLVQILITASLAGLVTFPGRWSVCRSSAPRGRGGRTGGPGADGHGGGRPCCCPALVRTGMSEIGEDADEVASSRDGGGRGRPFSW